MTQIPSSIGRLSKLQNLDLSHNLLTVLPSEIDELVALRVVNLAGFPFVG